MMRIGIIGGGAIGLLLAAYLSPYFEVTVYTRRQEQADRLNEQQLRLCKQGREQRIRVRAALFGAEKVQADVLFITVKQYHLSDVLSQLTNVPSTTTLLFLQNGMNHLRLLSQWKERNIVLGVVEHGALKHDDCTVEHTGIGKMTLSLFQGTLGQAEKLLDGKIPYFPIEYTDDWQTMLTDKLVVNAVINPLTTILRIQNGELIRIQEYTEMMKQLFAEVCDSLALSNRESAWHRIVAICEKTAANRSSMLSDIEHRRKTEVEAILGYVLEEGKKRGVATSLCQFLFYAVKGMEKHG
ncbi:putative 2-dehydropantoate 2-reductase [Anoxybacillus voinovskiensis]|nr:putative 2-dehydropantoate 2-reductase [Anoxybacillus voinovskiensis]